MLSDSRREWSLLSSPASRSDVARAFRGVLARFQTLGIEEEEFCELRRQYLSEDYVSASIRDHNLVRADEYGDLVELLLAHRLCESREILWLSCAIATACLGDNHLWQDMGLDGREALSRLLRDYFPRLYQKNVHNMKWKKFFYKELCARAQVASCKAPSCKVCTDYRVCFGPE